MKKKMNIGLAVIIGFVVLLAGGIIYRYVVYQSEKQQAKETIGVRTTETARQMEKDIQQFDSQQIEEATGLLLKSTTSDQVYDALTQPSAWGKLGYSTVVSEQIVKRFEESQEQAKSILQELATDQTRLLKIIVVTKQKYLKVSIGTTGSTKEKMTGVTEEKETVTLLQNITQLKIKIKAGEDEDVFEARYKVKSDQSEKISYENTITNESYEGEKAKQQLLILLQGVPVQSGYETEIKQSILKTLKISTPVKEFTFEAETINGDQIEFKDKDSN